MAERRKVLLVVAVIGGVLLLASPVLIWLGDIALIWMMQKLGVY